MSWPGFINRLLEATNKVEKVAIFNLEGVPVAVTDDISVSKVEGEALLRSLSDPSRSIALIHIDDIAYTCFQGNEHTLLGNNKSKGMTFVAYTAKDCIILVLGRSEGHGSFIFEVKRNLYMWDNDKGEKKEDQKPKPRKSRQSQNMEPNAIPRPASLSQPGDIPAPSSNPDNLMNLDEELSPPSPASDTAALSDEDILLDLSNQQQQVMY